jgi:hypothetical protein
MNSPGTRAYNAQTVDLTPAPGSRRANDLAGVITMNLSSASGRRLAARPIATALNRPAVR